MEIKYPLTALQESRLTGGWDVTVTGGNREYYMFSKKCGAAEAAFISQLVADANEAATIKADYERVSAKIDGIVEARVEERVSRIMGTSRSGLERELKEWKAGAEVDARVINGLRAAGSVVQDDNRKLRAENRRLKEEIGELLAARDLLSIKLDRVEKEHADTRLSPTKRRFIKHKDGDPNNNDIGNLEIDYAPGGVTWVSEVDPALAGRLNAAEKMSAHLQAASDTLDTLDPRAAAAAAIRKRAMQEQERSNVFYRDLAELLAKTFGVRFPFPKQHSEESEL